MKKKGVMTVKEKIIRKSIAHIEKKLKEINSILDSRPALAIFELQRETFTKAKAMDPRDASPYLAKAIKKEAELRKLLKKQHKLLLSDQPVKYEMELGDLKSELYFLELKKNGESI